MQIDRHTRVPSSKAADPGITLRFLGVDLIGETVALMRRIEAQGGRPLASRPNGVVAWISTRTTRFLEQKSQVACACWSQSPGKGMEARKRGAGVARRHLSSAGARILVPTRWGGDDRDLPPDLCRLLRRPDVPAERVRLRLLNAPRRAGAKTPRPSSASSLSQDSTARWHRPPLRDQGLGTDGASL